MLHTHTCTSFVGITQSSSPGRLVLDLGATDQITGNKSFFSSLSTSGYLPIVIMANGSRVSSHDVGTINLFHSLSIDDIFYLLESPFKLLSISRLTHSLIVLFLFPKNLFVYKIEIRDG